MPLKIIRNDITKVMADAIVNTANPKPIYADGTDRAIYQAAGAEKLLSAREKIGNIAPGEIAVTDAFKLSAKHIIHTVGPAWRDGKQGEFNILRSCYFKSLREATRLNCQSIAFPLIATGVYGFPKDEALQIAISEISEFLLKHEMLVYLVVFDDKSFQLSGKIMGDVQSFIDANYIKKTRKIKYNKASRRFREDFEGNIFLSSAAICDCDSVEGIESGAGTESNSSSKVSSLEEQLRNLGGTFHEKLFEIIKDKGYTNVEVYTRANLDRKLFSKIQCNVNYHPSKRTAMALCIGLKLNLDEAKDLLARAEWAFSPNRTTDLIIVNSIENREYNINQINAILFKYGQECLGV